MTTKGSLTVAEAGRLGGLKGGRSTSAAKARAARANGRKNTGKRKGVG